MPACIRLKARDLGMSIMKYIVDQMQGTIEIHSEVDKGTEFHITLDMKKINTQSEQMRLPDWNVLIVDDDAELCRTAAGALTEMGTTVEWALSGREAVVMAEERHREGRGLSRDSSRLENAGNGRPRHGPQAA